VANITAEDKKDSHALKSTIQHFQPTLISATLVELLAEQFLNSGIDISQKQLPNFYNWKCEKK